MGSYEYCIPCSDLTAEGVGPGVTTSIIEACLNNKELKVTRAGKRLLKSLNSEVSSDDPGSPGGNQSELVLLLEYPLSS